MPIPYQGGSPRLDRRIGLKRVLSAALLVALATPAMAQGVDEKGAAQLSGTLSRYIGKKAIENKLVTVAADGDGYSITINFQALAGMASKQELLKSDLPPYTFKVKPRTDGNWDVSSVASWAGSLEVKGGDKGPQSTRFSMNGLKFDGIYDPALAAFLSGTNSVAGMAMTTRDGEQEAEVSSGAGTAIFNSAGAADGGVDFTVSQKVADFVETIRMNDPGSGMKFPLTIKSPELSVEASGKGVRSRALLDLLAFGVANGDPAKVKASQAELKSLLLAALPLWQKVDGSYTFKDFAVDSPIGTFGASQLGVAVAADGISRNGRIDYTLRASGLAVPQFLVPQWARSLTPTEVQFSFGGANLDLDTMTRKIVEAFDLNKDPVVPDGLGEALAAEFMAKTPKIVIGHSIVKSSDAEIAFEGEVTFPGKIDNPEINTTIDVAGYDKIVETLQTGSKTMPDLAQYVPVALAIKGFGKALPDGRIEWVVNGKPDGSVMVNGFTVKPADPVGGDDLDIDNEGEAEPAPQ
jgi:hypothetical protein